MANKMYPKFVSALQRGLVNMIGADVRAMLVKDVQAFDNTHEFVSDLTGANIVQRLTAAMPATSTLEFGDNSVFDAGDVTFPAVPAGDDVILIIYINDGGVDTARRVAGYIDSGTNIPRTTDGDDIPVTWSNSNDRIWSAGPP